MIDQTKLRKMQILFQIFSMLKQKRTISEIFSSLRFLLQRWDWFRDKWSLQAF